MFMAYYELTLKSIDLSLPIVTLIERMMIDDSIKEAKFIFEDSNKENINIELIVSTDKTINVENILLDFPKKYDYIFYKNFLNSILHCYISDSSISVTPLKFNESFYELSITDTFMKKNIIIQLKSNPFINELEGVISDYNEKIKSGVKKLKISSNIKL